MSLPVKSRSSLTEFCSTRAAPGGWGIKSCPCLPGKCRASNAPTGPTHDCSGFQCCRTDLAYAGSRHQDGTFADDLLTVFCGRSRQLPQDSRDCYICVTDERDD